jgi:hypothetical protein
VTAEQAADAGRGDLAAEREQCLDHVLPHSELHLQSVLAEFVAY